MAKQMDHIDPTLQTFIKQQKIFFVATAANEGSVNLSPKGTDSFRVINKNKVVWMNLTGSGNETAAHLLLHNRMTIMFCSFTKKTLILRLYGKANVYHRRDSAYKKYEQLFPENIGARQIFEMHVEMVQTSCGQAVPFMEYKEDREVLNNWAKKQGEEKIKKYWKHKNSKTIDGFKTNILP